MKLLLRPRTEENVSFNKTHRMLMRSVFPTITNGACGSDTTTIPTVPTTDSCDDDSENSCCKSPHNTELRRQVAELYDVVVRRTSRIGENYTNDLGLDIEFVSELKKGLNSIVSKYKIQVLYIYFYSYKSEFGICSSNQPKQPEKQVAGKRMTRAYYPDFENEVKIVAKFSDHVNIARYESHSWDKDSVVLFTELCDFSLEAFISKEANVEKSCYQPPPKEILEQAIQGIKYLHGHRVLHRDIKPSNFLFKKHCQSYDKNCYVLKLIDFGLSKELDADRSTFLPRDALGTKSYMAPEQHEKEVKLTKATDIFSLGLLFYYVLTNGKHPFGEDETDIAYKIKHYTEHPPLEALNFEDNMEDKVLAKDLVLRMIQKLPENRPTIKEVEIHPYFWNAHTKQYFYKAANDVVQKRSADAKFLKSLNEGMGQMNVEDLNLPVKLKLPAKDKKTGEHQDSKGYSNVQEYIPFLRNLLEHCRPHDSHPPGLKEQREAMREHLTDDVEIRLPKLTKPYPRLLHHLYYLLQKEESFRSAFKKMPKLTC
ncbi:serine/threonine-protein kinase/endoribonuclease IRE2-like [Ciona intestinalis]